MHTKFGDAGFSGCSRGKTKFHRHSQSAGAAECPLHSTAVADNDHRTHCSLSTTPVRLGGSDKHRVRSPEFDANNSYTTSGNGDRKRSMRRGDSSGGSRRSERASFNGMHAPWHVAWAIMSRAAGLLCLPGRVRWSFDAVQTARTSHARVRRRLQVIVDRLSDVNPYQMTGAAMCLRPNDTRPRCRYCNNLMFSPLRTESSSSCRPYRGRVLLQYRRQTGDLSVVADSSL